MQGLVPAPVQQRQHRQTHYWNRTATNGLQLQQSRIEEFERSR
ncbi:Unknown protein sequence [Pseudomonas syringae pv. cilantro]|uniref:Uncharacterized protein n=1 Tax=Pseudomonas syringae pv. cilantro TaxID=81035 RepID=A0A0N0XAP5_PSESX|nr:Unknown protein sequence [Pseudomonas syringae pv. cilantro]